MHNACACMHSHSGANVLFDTSLQQQPGGAAEAYSGSMHTSDMLQQLATQLEIYAGDGDAMPA